MFTIALRWNNATRRRIEVIISGNRYCFHRKSLLEIRFGFVRVGRDKDSAARPFKLQLRARPVQGYR